MTIFNQDLEENKSTICSGNERSSDIDALEEKILRCESLIDLLIDYTQREQKFLIKDRQKVQESVIKNYDIGKNNIIEKGNTYDIYQDLPYRIGSVIVKNSKSISGVLRLPLYLVKEYVDYKIDPPNDNNCLSKEEFEKAKSHLSYRVGYHFTNAAKSSWDLVTAPGKILIEVYNFKKTKVSFGGK